MAEKRRLLDVWIVQTNTVYREVPFTVATDWIQQGRLLAEDKVRSAGGDKWHALGKVAALAAYLPRAEPQRVEDQAEALEPVEGEFNWKRPAQDFDDDVDMIPLIDISLVLLIFFVLTATLTPSFFSAIETPGAKHQLVTIDKDMFWVGIATAKDKNDQIKKENNQLVPVYSLGKDNDQSVAPTLDRTQITQRLQTELEQVKGDVRVRLRADKAFPIELIKEATLELQKVEQRINRERRQTHQPLLTLSILGEVSAPQK